MRSLDTDTIVAQATPPGRGGVGIVRISGPKVTDIAQTLLKHVPAPRYATFCDFTDHENNALDQGIALFFKAPHSFTGEDVLELQGHGGPVVMDMLVREALTLGARLARPGEFSERAFINDKLDLTQAEAIADLIDSSSEQAARCALQSLQGAFSEHIQGVSEDLTQLRIYVEAAIDFPEEEIDFLSDGHVTKQLTSLITQLEDILVLAQQGAAYQEGMTVVMAGRPNAGKSSLLNALSGRDTAIVTDVPGTTRDLLREQIHIDGMPLHIIDTAGLRDSEDPVEQEGIRRAREQIEHADRILLITDSTEDIDDSQSVEGITGLINTDKLTLIQNKIDLSDLKPEHIPAGETHSYPVIRLSAKQGAGIELIQQHLKDCMGLSQTAEGRFSARRRHLEDLDKALDSIRTGQAQLQLSGAGELLADDLRMAQKYLGEITGQVSSDDLLGRIFSSFCIGK